LAVSSGPAEDLVFNEIKRLDSKHTHNAGAIVGAMESVVNHRRTIFKTEFYSALTTTPASLSFTRPVTGLAGLKGGIMPRSTAQNLENILIDALEYYQEEEGAKIKTRTYSDVGMLTTDRGLVVTLPDGSQFQVTIVQSR